MKKVFVIATIITFLISLSSSHAQIPSSIDGIEIQTNVSNPRPGQSIEISIESFLYDLGSASVVWQVDGKTHDSGVGIKKINVVAPQIGVPMNISAVIKTPDGKETRKTLSIKTGSVDIIWESSGYMPPFYNGKIPFSYQNNIKLIAIPHLSKDGKTELDPKTLVYTWKRDGKYIENGQGYGIQSVEIPADDLPKNLDITVEVHNREQTLTTTGSINLVPAEPSISFYEDSLLYGILLNKALISNVPLTNREMKILVVPYGFTNEPENSYDWSINNIQQPDLLRNRSITIRTKDDMEGSSNIYLDVRNQENILQGARGGFTVYFNKKQ